MLTERYINPFTDFGFKRLFGQEVSKPVLTDFLNQLLPSEAQISELSFSKNEHLGKHDIHRRAVFDLYCIGKNNERFIVEIQKAKQKWFKDRSVYYASFPIQEQALKGEWDYQLQPVYTVGILDFIFEEDKDEPDKYLYRVKLSDIETRKVFYEKLSVVYLEIPKFQKTLDELSSRFEQWVYFLKHLTELKEIPSGLERDTIFQHFFEQAGLAALSPQEYNAYEESLKVYRDLKNVTDTAFDDGVEKGRIEGKVETARNLLQMKLPVEQISQATGLTVAEVEEIKNEN